MQSVTLNQEVTKSNTLNVSLSVNEKLLAMGQMAASLAHELRNPLGSIELYCSLLKKEVHGNEKGEEILRSLTQGVRTMGHIISNCLQFTKEIKPNKQYYKTAAVFLRETCDYARPSLNGDKITIAWREIGEEKFLMDPYLMGQVLINLIINAIDAVQNQINPKIEVILDHSNSDNWKLEVKDNGIGISKELKNKIFDPFFTTKEKGTGLGLAIVHVIVEGHGGTLEFNDAREGGVHVIASFNNRGN